MIPEIFEGLVIVTFVMGLFIEILLYIYLRSCKLENLEGNNMCVHFVVTLCLCIGFFILWLHLIIWAYAFLLLVKDVNVLSVNILSSEKDDYST